MVLYMIGLGLGEPTDITVKGLQAVKSSDHVYLEIYTSILPSTKEQLEEIYEKPVIEADRMMVESECEEMLNRAISQNVSFLVVGDVFGATTHHDLYLRAIQLGIQVEVIHNTSIINAVAIVGLQLYRYGEIVSIPFFTDTWRPYSFYDKVFENRKRDLHTLCLLDIKVKEQSEEDMMRGRLVFQPPRFMTAAQAASQILESEQQLGRGAVDQHTQVIAALRIGTANQKIVVKTLGELAETEDLGAPLHSLIIPGSIHSIEQEMLEYWKSIQSVSS